MSLLEIFYWLEYTPLLIEMRASPWLFPVIATIHLFGLVIIGSSVLVVNPSNPPQGLLVILSRCSSSV